MAKWNPIPGLRNYKISDDGCVAHAIHGIRRTQKRNGYVAISIHVYVHRLVWEAFHGPIPSGKEINHRDGNRANNHLSNLELVTRSENMQHCHRSLNPSLNRVRGIAHHKAKLTPDDVTNILTLRELGTTLKALGRRYNVSEQAIRLILKGQNWRSVTGGKPSGLNGPIRGAQHYRAKLTPDDVTNILALRRAGTSLRELGRRYNVSVGNIHAILQGRSWRQVTGIKPQRY